METWDSQQKITQFKPFTARQRRLLWAKTRNPDLAEGDIIRAIDSGQALILLKVDDRGVIVKRIGALRATNDRVGECYTVAHVAGS